jgi:hypothetical protein
MIASLDLLVQLNLHIEDQQSWQASQAVSIGVLGSSRILVVFERSADPLPPPRHNAKHRSTSSISRTQPEAAALQAALHKVSRVAAYVMNGLLQKPSRR